MTADVVVGWVHPGQVDAQFMDCMLRMLDHDRSRHGRVAGYAGMHCSANVSSGRNRLAAWFLDETPADWLLMVDTDMVWQPDDLDRLLANADPVRAPIVGGLCFARDYESGLIWPTLFHPEPVDGSTVFLRLDRWPGNTLFEVGGTGAAFLLVHRAVLEKVRAGGFSRAFPWFQETENPVGRVSEDLTFCARARAVGAPVHVHTGVEVGHRKSQVIGVADYLAQVAAP
ncbi:hypothetical protein ABT336_24195 [Micromonospora sp. NPDC000207]|uniref:glycosyltransferase family 2 protein n=1 Tax=Micromonospora sp. NPDC000207 TaxID=3154246 RepID=UPI0033264E2B